MIMMIMMILLMMSTVTAEVQTVGNAVEARDTVTDYETVASIAETCFVEQEEECLALIELKEAIGVSVHLLEKPANALSYGRIHDSKLVYKLLV